MASNARLVSVTLAALRPRHSVRNRWQGSVLKNDGSPRQENQEALYSAFVALVAEKGYDRISVQDILDEADVGRTTFYAHFKDKEDLLRFGFHRWRDQLASLPKSTAAERRAFMEALLGHVKRMPGFLPLSSAAAVAGLPKPSSDRSSKRWWL